MESAKKKGTLHSLDIVESLSLQTAQSCATFVVHVTSHAADLRRLLDNRPRFSSMIRTFHSVKLDGECV